MDVESSLFLAVFFGILLLLLAIAIGIVIFRAVLRKPTHNPPLVPSDDGHYEVVGKRVTCFHCGSSRFSAQEILLNTWLLSLLRIDWLDSSATVLSCDNCGRLTWFTQDGET
jgi:predicted nucleic-acid-binding Zn-ribbon protein